MTEEIIAQELLNILACPECRVDLELIQYQPGKNGLKCRQCQRIYPIEDGIPIMLVDQALDVKT
jgi:uncharacterized protein YbaR (Trm112 family)